MKLSSIVALGAAFLVGLGARPVIDWFANQSSGGANVRCIAGGKICVGMPPTAAFGYMSDDKIGGVLDVTCGYERPGAGAMNHLSVIDLMQRDCPESKYVISFSNGRRLTNLWVEAGRIARIDDYPRHTIDP